MDATPDSSHREQTSFIIRYVHFEESLNRYIVKERLLEFLDCAEKTGEAIAQLATNTLKKHAIPLEDARAQAYDNGSNMKGAFKGCQAFILRQNPLAPYSPCSSHTLNLSGETAASCCLDAITFFGVLQKLFNIFSSSPSRWEILQKRVKFSLHSDAVKPFAAHLFDITEPL